MGTTERVHDQHHHFHHHHHRRHPGLSFHYRQEHNDHHDRMKRSEIPKGCVAVIVGQGEEEQERVVVPVSYMNHPLFVELLKEAEEEYGFDQKGPISIPCRVDEFKAVQDQIDKDRSLLHHHHHHHHVWCFGV